MSADDDPRRAVHSFGVHGCCIKHVEATKALPDEPKEGDRLNCPTCRRDVEWSRGAWRCPERPHVFKSKSEENARDRRKWEDDARGLHRMNDPDDEVEYRRALER